MKTGFDVNQRILEIKEIRKSLKQELLELLRTMPYDEYLQTPEWQEKRKEALRRADYRCQLCNSDESLDVHHRTYERRGYELASDLIALCRDCHKTFHAIEDDYTAYDYFRRGMEQVKNQAFDDAIADFSESIKMDPDWPVSYNNRGACLEKKGDFKSALSDFTEAIRLDPDESVFLENQERVLKKINDSEVGLVHASSN